MQDGHKRELGKGFGYELEQDDELVRLAKVGDRSAFGELARRHRDEMFGHARRFVTWIQRIVRNQVYNKISRGSVVRERSVFTNGNFKLII